MVVEATHFVPGENKYGIFPVWTLHESIDECGNVRRAGLYFSGRSGRIFARVFIEAASKAGINFRDRRQIIGLQISQKLAGRDKAGCMTVGKCEHAFFAAILQWRVLIVADVDSP